MFLCFLVLRPNLNRPQSSKLQPHFVSVTRAKFHFQKPKNGSLLHSGNPCRLSDKVVFDFLLTFWLSIDLCQWKQIFTDKSMKKEKIYLPKFESILSDCFASLSEEFKCLFAKIDCFIFYIGKTYWPKDGIMFILVMKYSSSNQWTLVPLLQKKLTKCHVCARKTPHILFKWDMCVLSEMCIKCSYFSSH